MLTRSDRSISLAREQLLNDTSVVGLELRERLRSVYDEWLSPLVPRLPGVALVAVGGLGRGEVAPHSDLDLVLLHSSSGQEIASVAESIWYPIWDAGIGLDHSVRTVDEALKVARYDIKAFLGLLDIRHIAGDPDVTASARSKVTLLWRANVLRRADGLRELAVERQELHGDLAFLLEPNLKDSAGGLRDWNVLRAFALAQMVDLRWGVGSAQDLLLDVRGELHRTAGRRTDVLRAQDRLAIAKALGMPDEDSVLRSVNDAGRTISYATDLAWRRVQSLQPSIASRLRNRFGGTQPQRVGLAQDVVSQNGDVVLAREADPKSDPGLTMRAARAAAESGLGLSPFTLERLRTASAPIPQPWTPQIRSDFVALLGTGSRSVAVLESLDQHGLLERYIPEWVEVRSRAQHNPVHRYTVDRHLVETAVHAASEAASVRRPDLLLAGAILHDIGKAYPGVGKNNDHSVSGAEVAAGIATRMGFPPEDVTIIVGLVRHHLLLADTATRRDIADPATVVLVASAIDSSADVLELLHVLTRADAAATGPAAWSEWKSRLVDELVARTHTVLSGTPVTGPEPIDGRVAELLTRCRHQLGGEIDVVINVVSGKGSADVRVLLGAKVDRLTLAATSGLLALHSLDVRSATLSIVDGLVVHDYVVEPRFGGVPTPERLRAALTRIQDGSLDLDARLAAKEAAYQPTVAPTRATPVPGPASARLLWFDDEATDSSLLEVRTADSIGLLHRLTTALEASSLVVRSAMISSFGQSAVDAFYVTLKDGSSVPNARRVGIESAVAAAVQR